MDDSISTPGARSADAVKGIAHLLRLINIYFKYHGGRPRIIVVDGSLKKDPQCDALLEQVEGGLYGEAVKLKVEYPDLLTDPPNPTRSWDHDANALRVWAISNTERLAPKHESHIPLRLVEKESRQASSAKIVWEDIPAQYREAIEQYHVESEAAQKKNRRLKVEAFCSKHDLDAQVFRGYREQVRGRKRRGRS